LGVDLQQTLFWKHRDDLLRILTVLWRVAGLGGRKTIRQSVYLAVVRLLRPAEAATRRLIVVLAQSIAVTLKPFRSRQPAADGNQAGKSGAPLGQPEQSDAPEPVWRDFALADPLPRWPDWNAEPRGFRGIVRGPDREIDGQRLAQRFEALNHALDDLSAQAQRLARWTALRKRARQRGRFRSTTPLRPGPPLDLRGAAKRRLKKHELFDILDNAHQRACFAMSSPPDTS